MANENNAPENKAGETSEVVKIETKAEAVVLAVTTGAAEEVMPTPEPKRVILGEKGLPSPGEFDDYLRSTKLNKHGD